MYVETSAGQKFFDLFARKDLEGMMRLWSDQSPELASRRKNLSESFAKADYSFGELTISQMKLNGDRLSLRAGCDLKILDKQSGKESTERTVRAISLIKEGDGWKIWSFDLIETYQTARAIAEKINDRPGLAEMLNILGLLLNFRGRSDEAENRAV